MNNKISEPCSARLRKALEIRNLKQSELCKLTGIPKSAVSEYLSGLYEPKQHRLMILSKVLNVNPVWLMGFDVPMERVPDPSPKSDLPLTEGERRLIELFRLVPLEKQDMILQMIEVVLKNQL